MRRAIAVSVALTLIITTALFSQEKGRQDAKQTRQPQQAAFQQVFVLQGVEFSEDQRAKVDEISNKYVPKLAEIQKKQQSIFTEEQMQARREAYRAAREAGKEGRALQEAARAAIKLTEEQQKQLAAIQEERAELTTQIQNELRALLTRDQRTQLRGQGRAGSRRPAVPPTHPDLKYGPYDRNVMDVWLAESDKPTPVLVSIHGGGFRGGNKSVSGDILKECLESGISVVAITYRLSDEAIAPAQFLDSARAIQFIRHNAKKWNLDPKRMAATGGSAGAGISLWLGFHDDLADADNDDPVLRESTRLTCMAVYNGQTSYDPRFIRNLFPGTDTYQHPALAQLYDADLTKLDDLPQEKYKLFEEVSALPHLTKDDVPAALFYASKMDTPITNQGIGIHHPKFGKALKEEMDKLGIECEVHTGIPRGDEWVKLTVGFVKKHLAVK
ncbi:MAG: alpha/beta hydrolase fold domain-containing protein [Planctomycetes bacterium]|nr:alpha/beta hydrolase fold domain-containing protein [Planctomycetota bacterium]MBL7042045.1 alpha/beta hydrolase fold domain-containing protein [Pirellulaceae bacterium]